MCKSVFDYQKKNLCISATLKSCVLALDKASAPQVLATKHLHIFPHLSASSHLHIFATSLRISPHLSASSHPRISTSLCISLHLSISLRISASSHHFRLLLHTQLPSRILKQKVLLKLRRDNSMMRRKLITKLHIKILLDSIKKVSVDLCRIEKGDTIL